MGWKDLIQGGVQFSVSHIKTYLLKMLVGPRLEANTSASRDPKLPTRKVLPTLLEVIDDVKVKDEDIIQERDQ